MYFFVCFSRRSRLASLWPRVFSRKLIFPKKMDGRLVCLCLSLFCATLLFVCVVTEFNSLTAF